MFCILHASGGEFAALTFPVVRVNVSCNCCLSLCRVLTDVWHCRGAVLDVIGAGLSYCPEAAQGSESSQKTSAAQKGAAFTPALAFIASRTAQWQQNRTIGL